MSADPGMNDEPERETVLFTVSADVAQATIAQVASCEECNPARRSSHLNVFLTHMKMRMVIVSACLGSLITVSGAYGQKAQRGPADPLLFSGDPCPGGDVGVIDGLEAYTIHDLIQSSELVIKGTVVRVLASEVLSGNRPNLMHTTSLISVDEVLRGTPPRSNTIAITQLGGRVPPCTLTVKDSPLVDLHEEYIFFLLRDPRTDIPNNSGSPPYALNGVYGGKAKIVDGKIQFNPSALEGLREYDNNGPCDVQGYREAGSGRS